ncbi:MAG: CoA transferase [Chloroflexi bacterium]|nr:CoA transferase [Chloroflexota bacterium]
MLAFAGHEPDDARGYMTLGTGPLNRFYQAGDGKWLFLAAHSGLPTVEGLDPARLEESFTSAPAAEWVRRLRQAGVPAQERVPVDELMADPYVRERGLAVHQQIEGMGDTTAPGLPVRLSRTPMRVGDTPRRPGSDAPAILKELGLEAELPRLEKAWVLQVNDLPPAWGAAM